MHRQCGLPVMQKGGSIWEIHEGTARRGGAEPFGNHQPEVLASLERAATAKPI